MIIEELLERLQVPPRSRWSNLLSSFATGRTTQPWNGIIDDFQIEDDQSTQDRFIQLGFLRRYPEYFENQDIDRELRISTLEVPHDEGLRILKHAIEPSTLSLDVIQQGYLSDYIGHDEVVTPILQTLNKHAANWRQAESLAPCTSIIGPTMCGKTRLLMELGKEVCVVYICLRPHHSSGEPKRSQLATEMLKRPLSTNLEEYYVKFITAILSVVVTFFESEGRNRKKKLQQWYKHHTSADTHFYSDFQLEFEKQTTSKTTTTPQLASVAQKLSKTPILRSSSLKVLLAIDEAKALLRSPESRTDSPEKSLQEVPLFRFFRRALRNLPDGCGVFAILADTNSRVANFNPRLEDDSSARPFGIRAEPFKVYSPIYEIRTMDRMVPANLPKTWDELLSPERLCKYGLPVFSISLQLAIKNHAVADPAAAIDPIARFAVKKLLGSEKPGPVEMTESRALALLGPTIGVPLHGQARQNAKLMASHAAHCGFIDASRGCQYSFYPSQPIYALAANDYLQKNEDVVISCINSLTAVLSQGHVGTGDVGEIVSRIILLCAMNETVADMKAAKKTLANSVLVERTSAADMDIDDEPLVDSILVDSISFPDPVPVTKFLETLTGCSADKLPLGSIDLDHKRKLFKQGLMFWNHFMHTSCRPTSESLLECMHRGLALQCRSNQEAFDQVLPIYLKDQSVVELDESSITFCGIQVKNRQQDDVVKFIQSSMNPTTAKFEMKAKNNPYLALYFSLQSTSPENKKREDNYCLPSHGPADPRQASLVFYGLESFQFLSPEVKNALKNLIDIRTDLVCRHEKETIGKEYAKDFLLRADYRRLS
jgi:hypothetical protein